MTPINSNPSSSVSNLKRKADPIHPSEKTSRKISKHEDNVAASMSHWENLEEGIREHAYLRIQIFHAVATKLEGWAKRSNGTVTDVDVRVGRATKQDGQGTREMHAAHANAAAGLRDDLKERYIKQIVGEGVTPVKAAFFSRIRNMQSDDLENLKQHQFNETYVREAVEKIWPGNSALSGTDFEDQINATDRLPRALNLGCDLTLEKAIRPFVADLMKQVMQGGLTPKQATDQYVQAIQTHFAAKIEEITEKLKGLKASTPINSEEIKKWETQLSYHQNEMNGTIPLEYDQKDCKKTIQF